MPRKRSRSQIQFPILKRLEVRGYALFPGVENDDGFSHELVNGVSVIVGINGIGKTTLLNLIFRMLVGPFEPSKLDTTKPGSGMHKLTEKRTLRYFAERVPDAARDAWAEAEFQLGDKTLTVRRRLSDMRVIELSQDDWEWEDPDEETFQEVCNDLAGTKTAYDFHFMVRHLVFFLEERAPLIWSEHGQFEILRILFYDDEARVNVAELTDEARTLDSQYRNRLYHFNRQKASFEEELEAIESEDEVIQDLESHKALVSGIEKRGELLSEQEDLLSTEIDKLETEVFRLQMEIEEERQSIRHSEAKYFSQLFPSLDDTSKLVLNSLLTDDGCLVCGSDGNNAAARIRKALKARHCPVCDSPPEKQEPKPPTPLSTASLARSNKKYDSLRSRLDAKRSTLQDRQTEYEKVASELRTLTKQRFDYDRQIRRLTDRLPANHDAIAEQEESLRTLEAELKRIERQRKARLGELRTAIVDQDSKIESVVNMIVSTFNKYATTFLAEECRLEHGYVEQRVGEGGEKIRLPAFKVLLASGADPSPTERSDPDQVSESQKEFVDLAFRMALMQAAAGKLDGRMLVIETPEASLDSVFIDQAGLLLRKFGQTPRGGAGNVVLTSCNINGAEMIQSLLGTNTGQSKSRGKAAEASHRKNIDKRLIDLTVLAAPSAAYRKHQDEYDNLKEKLYG